MSEVSNLDWRAVAKVTEIAEGDSKAVDDCRSFSPISSGLCIFLGTAVLLDTKKHASSRTTSAGRINL